MFIVGHLGNWRAAAAVLFEPEGMRRDSAPIDGEGRHRAAPGTGVRTGAWWNGDDLSQTLDAVLAKLQALPEKNRFPAVVDGGRLRYITPLEAERLQGLPDHYTAVQFNGKPAANSHRYKAIGNSMPVPVMRWIGMRIAAVEAIIQGETHVAG